MNPGIVAKWSPRAGPTCTPKCREVGNHGHGLPTSCLHGSRGSNHMHVVCHVARVRVFGLPRPAPRTIAGSPPQSQWWPGPNARRPQHPNRSRLKQHNCLGFCPSCALDTNADPAPNSSSHFAHCHSEFTIEFGTLPSCRCHAFSLQNPRCCKRRHVLGLKDARFQAG